MGNVTGQITWKLTSPNEKEWRAHLIKMAIDRGLVKADNNMMMYVGDHYVPIGVEISGIRLGWVGRENAMTRVRSYLYEATEYLVHVCKLKRENIDAQCFYLPI